MNNDTQVNHLGVDVAAVEIVVAPTSSTTPPSTPPPPPPPPHSSSSSSSPRPPPVTSIVDADDDDDQQVLKSIEFIPKDFVVSTLSGSVADHEDDNDNDDDYFKVTQRLFSLPPRLFVFFSLFSLLYNKIITIFIFI